MQREAKEVTVTYHAPTGDSKVVEAFGHTFYDGKPETVEVETGSDLLRKMMGNKHFEVAGAEVPPPVQDARQGQQRPAHEPDDRAGRDTHKDHKGR